MSGNVASGTATATSSTNSGQGSEPLSDAFVAVEAGGEANRKAAKRVMAPEGSDRFFVRRSSRVASSRSQTAGASSSNPVMEVVDAPPGGKRKTGYAYQVLQPVAEEAGPPIRTVEPVGNAGGLRDTATPQQVLISGSAPSIVGRKRSATSAAPAPDQRGSASKRLASAADFSPTHFDEPVSDGHIPAFNPTQHQAPSSPHQRSFPPSPMAVEPEAPLRPHSQHGSSAISSPISQNPLLRRDDTMAVLTPSPSRRRNGPQVFRTQDANAAWAAAQGLLPIGEGFTAPGYVPTHLVGGIRYSVRSPTTAVPHQSITQHANVGRQLFVEYTDSAAKGGDLQQQVLPESPHLQQQTITLNVRHYESDYMRIY